MKKLFWYILPYLTSILSGVGIFYLSFSFNENIKNLLINISAALFAIPLIYLFYQSINYLSKRHLNREIYNYAKWKIDRNIFSIIHQISKSYIVEINNNGFIETSIFNELNKEILYNKISSQTYLGFQVFKKLDNLERVLERFIENPFVLNRLEDKEILSLIRILKKLVDLEVLIKKEDILILQKERFRDLEIVKSNDIGPYNNNLSERIILLKKIDENSGEVIDFGDFEPFKKDSLLNTYKINKKYLTELTNCLHDLLSEIYNWWIISGHKIMIDERDFKMTKRR